MAYRSSVHECTGFTPHYLVFGQEISLVLNLMYRLHPSKIPIDVKDSILQKKDASRQAYELVRRNATAQQHRRSNLYNEHVHGPTYKEGEHVLFQYPVVQPGNSPKLSSPWRGPYEILKCLNDVNYQIKSQISSPRSLHSQCGQTFLLFTFAQQLRSPNPSNHPTSPIPSPTPSAEHFLNRSPSVTPPLLLSSARPCSLPSPTRFFDHERRPRPPVSMEPRCSTTTRKNESSKPSPKKTTFAHSPSRLDSLIDGASGNLRH